MVNRQDNDRRRGQRETPRRGSSRGAPGGHSRRTGPPRREITYNTRAARLLDSLCILPPKDGGDSGKTRFRKDIARRAEITFPTLCYVSAEESFFGLKTLAALNLLGRNVEPRHLDLLDSDFAGLTKRLISREVGEEALQTLVEAQGEPSDRRLENERRAVITKAKDLRGFDDKQKFQEILKLDPNTFERVLKGERHLTSNRVIRFAQEVPELTIAEVACFATMGEKKLLLKLGKLAAKAAVEEAELAQLAKIRMEALQLIVDRSNSIVEVFDIPDFLKISGELFERKIDGHEDFSQEEVSKLLVTCSRPPVQMAASLLPAEEVGAFLMAAHAMTSQSSSRPRVMLPDWLETYKQDLQSLVDKRAEIIERVLKEHFDGLQYKLEEHLGVEKGIVSRTKALHKTSGALRGNLQLDTARKLLELGCSKKEALIFIAPGKWKGNLDFLEETEHES